MGVVFGVLAGYYYWSPKFIGYMYDEFLGRVQFVTLFIGVNLTFFPMHFLGLAGMPRRICDYPDSYGYWNTISSIGSIISFASLLLFIYIIYYQLSEKVVFNNWYLPSYFFSSVNKNFIIIPSLEWALPNPPGYHHYHETPII